MEYLNSLSALVTARVSRKPKTVDHCCELYSFPCSLPPQYSVSITSKLDANVKLRGVGPEPVAASLLVSNSHSEDELSEGYDSSVSVWPKNSAEMLDDYDSICTPQEQCSDDIYDTIDECDTCEICLSCRASFTKLKSNLRSMLKKSHDVTSSRGDCWFPPTPPIPHATSDYEEVDITHSANSPAVAGGARTVVELASGCKPKRVRFSENVDVHFVMLAEEEVHLFDGNELV